MCSYRCIILFKYLFFYFEFLLTCYVYMFLLLILHLLDLYNTLLPVNEITIKHKTVEL